MANPVKAGAGAKKSAGDKKGKSKGDSLSSLYNISSDKLERKNKFCPKCGPGMFLGRHKDREVCGKCKYVEYSSK